MVRKKAAILCFLYSVSMLCTATTWYVRPSTGEYGSEDGSSYADAFDGFADHNAACASINDGDTVKIDGTFSGEQLIPCPGSSNGYVTYTYYDSANPPILDGNAGATAPVSSSNLDYWKLVGPLTVRNGSAAALVNIFGGSSDVIIDGITCTGQLTNTNFCIRGRDMVRWTVKNTTVHNSEGSGIAADIGAGAGGGQTIRLHNNTTYNNTYRGIVVAGSISSGDIYYDVDIYDNTSYSNGDGYYISAVNGFNIYGNSSYNNEETTYAPAEQYGVGVQQCRNGNIYKNTIYSNKSDGIEVWGDADGPSSNVHTFSNLVYSQVTGTGSSGSAIEYATQYSPGAKVYGNVIIGNNQAFRFSKDSTNSSRFYNNTLVDNVTGLTLADSGGFALSGWTFEDNIVSGGAWFSGERNDNSLVFTNNNYYNGTGSYNGVSYTTSNITSLDITARILNPSFVGSTVSDKASWVHQTSGLYGSGTPTPSTVDAYGNSCGTTPDIGAFCDDIIAPYGHTLKPKKRR